MSDEVIYSDDCLVEILVSDTWYPLLCQSDMSFKIQQEVILKTGPNSGLSKEKTTRLSEAFATVSGLSPINNGTNISIFYIIQESIRTQPQTIRFKYYDQVGTSKQISGSVVIVSVETGMTIGDFMQGTIDMEFSGGVTIDVVTAPPAASGDSIFSDTWTTTAGQNYISGLSSGWKNGTQYSLVGKEIIEVDREGMQYDFIGNDQTPGNRECSWNTSLNRLVFEYNFNSGETVFVIFK